MLEAAIVFLIQNDQAKVRCRCEDRTASPNDDLHMPGGDLTPVPRTLGRRQMRMQHGHSIETGSEPLPRLRSQTDLGHQHDRLPTKLDHLLDGADVNFRFPTSRDAVHQERLVRIGFHMADDRIERHLLFGIQRQVFHPLFAGNLVRLLLNSLCRCDDQASLSQRRDWPSRAANGVRQLARRPVLGTAA